MKRQQPLLFAGVMIKNDQEGYLLEQNAYFDQIEKRPQEYDLELFRTTSHRLPWINQTRPEILAGINILSQVKKETYIQEDTKTINDLIKYILTYPKAGLRYVKLDNESLNIVLYSDGSVLIRYE